VSCSLNLKSGLHFLFNNFALVSISPVVCYILGTAKFMVSPVTLSSPPRSYNYGFCSTADVLSYGRNIFKSMQCGISVIESRPRYESSNEFGAGNRHSHSKATWLGCLRGPLWYLIFEKKSIQPHMIDFAFRNFCDSILAVS